MPNISCDLDPEEIISGARKARINLFEEHKKHKFLTVFIKVLIQSNMSIPIRLQILILSLMGSGRFRARSANNSGSKSGQGFGPFYTSFPSFSI